MVCNALLCCLQNLGHCIGHVLLRGMEVVADADVLCCASQSLELITQPILASSCIVDHINCSLMMPHQVCRQLTARAVCKIVVIVVVIFMFIMLTDWIIMVQVCLMQQGQADWQGPHPVSGTWGTPPPPVSTAWAPWPPSPPPSWAFLLQPQPPAGIHLSHSPAYLCLLYWLLT